jgi:hypothetical protein
MAMKKLFIIQYSQELDQFQLQEIDNPQELPNFQIPIITTLVNYTKVK